jgi:hypothetical protein
MTQYRPRTTTKLRHGFLRFNWAVLAALPQSVTFGPLRSEPSRSSCAHPSDDREFLPAAQGRPLLCHARRECVPKIVKYKIQRGAVLQCCREETVMCDLEIPTLFLDGGGYRLQVQSVTAVFALFQITSSRTKTQPAPGLEQPSRFVLWRPEIAIYFRFPDPMPEPLLIGMSKLDGLDRETLLSMWKKKRRRFLASCTN